LYNFVDRQLSKSGESNLTRSRFPPSAIFRDSRFLFFSAHVILPEHMRVQECFFQIAREACCLQSFVALTYRFTGQQGDSGRIMNPRPQRFGVLKGSKAARDFGRRLIWGQVRQARGNSRPAIPGRTNPVMLDGKTHAKALMIWSRK
jgi:hypothetical protein